ncbi:protein takeout-like [Haematobia irritans]|uniref:protein takeout-like n=1 Tax=Haematobia irritans TaxID=7368 RepID=UPI003F50AE5D
MRFFEVSTFFMVLSVALAELPNDIPKCKYGDGSCIANSITYVLGKYSSGSRDINLLSIDPLHVKKMTLERNPTSPVNIDITFTDFDIIGLKNLKVSSIDGFKEDFSGRNTIHASIDSLRLTGRYKVDGRVLILSVVGDGECDLVMDKPKFKLSFDIKKVEKGGKIFIALEHIKLELLPGSIHFKFDNLFNGNKELGDNFNYFINENWNDIWKEMGSTFCKAIGVVLKKVINNFFEKDPAHTYFA